MDQGAAQGPAFEISGLQKSFGANRVLRGIDLAIPARAVTVLMGANGAGKSTLVKIAAGVHAPDQGEMRLAGRPYSPATPAEAIDAGIVVVHQNINDGVAPDLDVASNLMLDRLAGGRMPILFNPRRVRAEAGRIAELMGLEMDLTAPVRRLSLADRQMVAIARAMARDPKLLILDEPTSSLSDAEAQRLFALVDRLRAQGVAILYISHRMSDIRRVADQIVTLRDGRITGIFDRAPLDYEGAVDAMLGHGLTDVDIQSPPPGEPVLEVTDLQLVPGARPFSLTLRRNEVTALTGLVGTGKTAFAEVLFGLRRPVGGEIRLHGRPYAPGSPSQAIAAGVFLSAKDRATNAVVPQFDLMRNLTLPFLPRYSRAAIVSRGRERQVAQEQIAALRIVCQSERDGIQTLSGGNQQKVMVARWLSQPSRLLILDEPFQGVDIGARRDLGDKLRETASGRATLVLCAELDEALEVADRILVMADHSLAGDHPNRNVDLDLILAQVAGSGSARQMRAAAAERTE